MKSTGILVYAGTGVCVVFLGVVFLLYQGSRPVSPPRYSDTFKPAIPEDTGEEERIPIGTEEQPAVEEPQEKEEESGLLSPEIEREVILFFQSATRDRLFPEIRRIVRTASAVDQAKQVVVELISGSREGNLPVVPRETRLREIYRVGDGTLVVDFSQDLVDHHSGGSADEIATLYGIVNSLTVNFPEFRRVRILVEGEERDTLKYHVDLTRSYQQDLSRVEELFL